METRNESIINPEIGNNDWRKLKPDDIDNILYVRIREYESNIAGRGGKRPKREGYILEKIASINNLLEADMEAQKGKSHKNRYIRRHNLHRMENLRRLQLMILTLDFPPSHYKSDLVVTACGKQRTIVKRNFYPWRILEHAIMRILMPIVVSRLISDSVACIKGRGLHFGVRRMKRFLRLHQECGWFWKSDYKKYYQSVPHRVIDDGLRKRIKDEKFFRLLQKTIFCYESGEEIINQLEDEETRKERYANWLIHESAVRSPCVKHSGSPHEGGGRRQVLPSLLRRYCGIGSDAGRSEESTQLL